MNISITERRRHVIRDTLRIMLTQRQLRPSSAGKNLGKLRHASCTLLEIFGATVWALHLSAKGQVDGDGQINCEDFGPVQPFKVFEPQHFAAHSHPDRRDLQVSSDPWCWSAVMSCDTCRCSGARNSPLLDTKNQESTRVVQSLDMPSRSKTSTSVDLVTWPSRLAFSSRQFGPSVSAHKAPCNAFSTQDLDAADSQRLARFSHDKKFGLVQPFKDLIFTFPSGLARPSRQIRPSVPRCCEVL